jgi:phosphoenolpyruvate synthase/pyruvate phosphate dikinase
MKKPKREHYNELFRFENQITVLHSEFFATGAMKQGEVLIASDDRTWSSFIHKEKEKDCLKAGLALFSSKEKYEQYSQIFRHYINNIARPIILKYSKAPKNLDRGEVEKLFRDLSIFWYYYGFTEYSFHDLAHETMLKNKNKILQRNLNDLGKLKFEGREILNAYIFKGGVLNNMLDSISNQFLKIQDANFLLTQELLGLFSGKKIDQQIIDNRKKHYVLRIKEGRLHEYSYKEAKKIHAIFTSINKANELIGTIANKGKIVGRTIVAPMLSNQMEVKKIIAKMKKGDILVAQTTSPEYMPLCRLAGGIVTDQGGMLSHAAIVSRELNIPCIVGTNIATQTFKDGDTIEVDANKGIAKKIISKQSSQPKNI